MKFIGMKFIGLIILIIVSLGGFNLAQANVIGPDAQNFNPITSGLDFVTVQSSETLKPGIINLGTFLNYAVNSLPYIENSPQGRTNFNDSLLGLDLNAGIGILRGWDFGFSLPQIVQQTVSDQNGSRGEFSKTGATEVRLNTKVRFFGDDSGGAAIVGSMNINRIENNPFIGTNAPPIFDLEVVGDMTIGRVALGANAGYRFRQPGTPIPNSVFQPLKDQIILSTAASYHISEWDTKAIAEIYGSLPAQKSTSDGQRSLSSAELLVGLKHDINTNLAVHAGVGTELAEGVASPDYRVYTGLNYTFGPVFKDPQRVTRTATTTTRDEIDTDLEKYIEVLPSERTANGEIEHFRTQKILFAFDSDQMVGRYAAALAELATYLKQGFKELVVEGHTDSIGAAAYNQKLSQRRAVAIKRYLVTHFRFNADKISTVGYGEMRPIADNGNYQGRQLNRRVDFQVRR